MKGLDGYRVWKEDSDEETLYLQGHPGMGDVLREKFTYDFDECHSGCVRDLWVNYRYENGVWTESYECDKHVDGSGWRSITLGEFNELICCLNEE